jgi:hypothetical protein
MIAVSRYSPDRKGEWDAFARAAKNVHFFFQRDYLEYHADRFADHSLLFHQGRRLVALLPAHLCDGAPGGRRLVSHGGLTFGGFLTDDRMTTRLMLELFAALIAYLGENGVGTLVYKCVPHIYHRLPAEEDRYALFVRGARLCRRDVTSAVEQQARPPFQERRRRGARKAESAGVAARVCDDFGPFWAILEETLRSVHGARPVHTLAEIEMLRGRFPDNIRLFGAYQGGRLLAGVVVYENATVAHAQYIAAGEEGKRVGALDALFGWLITQRYRDKRYFDFGTSTGGDGRALNGGLVDQKEGFGARGVVHDQYELDVAAALSAGAA